MINAHYQALTLAAQLVTQGHDIATHLMEDSTYENYGFTGLDNSIPALSAAISILTPENAVQLENDLHHCTADYL
jgi:hypothetical protein